MQDLHGQPRGLRDVGVWTHVHLYHLWETNGRMPYMQAVCGPRGPHIQGLKKRGSNFFFSLKKISYTFIVVQHILYKTDDHITIIPYKEYKQKCN